MAIVYRHRRLDNNDIFYVGVSTNDKRPYNTACRHKDWIDVYNRCEVEVEIVKVGIPASEALELENLLILEYGRADLNSGKLVNKTNGGENNRSRLFTKSHKNKISKSLIGIKRSKETKQKISDYNKGKKLSKKHRKILIESNKVPVKQLTRKGEFVKTFDCLKDAAKELGIKSTNISKVLKNKKPTAGNYKWEYA